jgi:hypothetical protein
VTATVEAHAFDTDIERHADDRIGAFMACGRLAVRDRHGALT